MAKGAKRSKKMNNGSGELQDANERVYVPLEDEDVVRAARDVHEDEFAEHERRSLGNLAAILLEWSFEQLKAAGNTTRLFGQSAKRLNKLTRDRRLKHG